MGNPVVHFELWSKSPEQLSDFYRQIFDWKITPMPELTYNMVDTGGAGGINGGIRTPEEGPYPGNMTMYLLVDDLAAYRKRVQEAGGKIVLQEQEVPGRGAFSLVADPDGRVIGLWKMLKT